MDEIDEYFNENSMTRCYNNKNCYLFFLRFWYEKTSNRDTVF